MIFRAHTPALMMMALRLTRGSKSDAEDAVDARGCLVAPIRVAVVASDVAHGDCHQLLQRGPA